ncbi:hypothetical protein ACFV0O_05155 [Kitasatospora sp. NPDC059577]|uniref:hypothetical protein n=1 Tax=Kitasatospora sp. NPDC059577 TaxID=3346873 RepID=UPI00368409C9
MHGRIGREALRCLPRGRGTTFQRTGTWQEPPGPGRETNARRLDVLTARHEERARVRSEKGIRWGGRPLDTAA